MSRSPFWHYVPWENKRTDDVIRFTPKLEAALKPWIEAAQKGELREKILSYTPGGEVRPKYDFEITPDLAAALRFSKEWDGYLMAGELARKGWPADADLVQRCHRWSCDLERSRRDAWKKKRLEDEERKKNSSV